MLQRKQESTKAPSSEANQSNTNREIGFYMVYQKTQLQYRRVDQTAAVLVNFHRHPTDENYRATWMATMNWNTQPYQKVQKEKNWQLNAVA